MNNPMPLSVALNVCFPHGGVQKSTLMKAIGQGKLKCFRLGRSYMVTETDIKDWIESCHVKKTPDCGSANVQAENQDGSSLTTDVNTQQAIAEQIARRLRNTSAKNTRHPGTGETPAKVIHLKSRSHKS